MRQAYREGDYQTAYDLYNTLLDTVEPVGLAISDLRRYGTHVQHCNSILTSKRTSLRISLRRKRILTSSHLASSPPSLHCRSPSQTPSRSLHPRPLWRRRFRTQRRMPAPHSPRHSRRSRAHAGYRRASSLGLPRLPIRSGGSRRANAPATCRRMPGGGGVEGARRRELWRPRGRVGAEVGLVQGRGRRKERSNVTVSTSHQIDGVLYSWFTASVSTTVQPRVKMALMALRSVLRLLNAVRV